MTFVDTPLLSFKINCVNKSKMVQNKFFDFADHACVIYITKKVLLKKPYLIVGIDFPINDNTERPQVEIVFKLVEMSKICSVIYSTHIIYRITKSSEKVANS